MGVSIFSPAKINLFLAVTGRRPDGYHELVSVAAPLDFGDELTAEPGKTGFSLTCDDATVPVDKSNLVLRAAEAFALASGWRQPVHFHLTKRIPLGAGLGGGSSNAVATLRALHQLSGAVLSAAELAGVAAGLGSDCPLFLANGPVVLRGRGERIDALPGPAAARLRGRRILLFKPGFAIGTAWAYQRMVTRGSDYLSPGPVEQKLAGWLAGSGPVEELLSNNMEGPAFEKYLALPVLREKFRHVFGAVVHMSGSGSACFALPEDDAVAGAWVKCIRECWGPVAFVREARLT